MCGGQDVLGDDDGRRLGRGALRLVAGSDGGSPGLGYAVLALFCPRTLVADGAEYSESSLSV